MTDFTLRVTEVIVLALSQAVSTMVAQECHFWLNIAEMRDSDKVLFLDSPISQGGLYSDTVEGFALQVLAAIKHILPQHDSSTSFSLPTARTPSTCCQGQLACHTSSAAARVHSPATASSLPQGSCTARSSGDSQEPEEGLEAFLRRAT